MNARQISKRLANLPPRSAAQLKGTGATSMLLLYAALGDDGMALHPEAKQAFEEDYNWFIRAVFFGSEADGFESVAVSFYDKYGYNKYGSEPQSGIFDIFPELMSHIGHLAR